ncbi:MAG: 16S rRNA (cytosine(1402)-N(4))-methyltransferase RsmH [Bacteroidales bacterium]|nr:16S rRNA (cytosine(1402)-N(4))-methyltransferase RsmH [Bacteroidales bacterium]MBN2756843.1 16S rRNA (cytosine(1402)-N(4))-methyltransferase RsmH [Bacteroidales bacterium]
MSTYHTPVLIHQSIEGLNIKPDGTYVDVTFGGGGHSKEILKQLKKGRLIAFDQDLDAIDNIIEDSRFLFVRSNYRFINNFLKYHKINKVDGIIADLGVSSYHFDEITRGFSFRADADIDMRMNQDAKISASYILNNYDENDLINIFRKYGEITNSPILTKKIIEYRKTNEINRINQLLKVIEYCTPKKNENKYFAKVFQALRIEVNQEIESLKELLESTLNILNEKGRLVVISYHSLEDRVVKNFIKSGNFEGTVEKDIYGNFDSPFNMINRKVIIPSDEELVLNPRSRSAKLRIAEKN